MTGKYSVTVLLAIHFAVANILYFPVYKKSTRRRNLQDSGYWNVLNHPDAQAIEGADYFYAVMNIGTPPRPYDLILDTGSSVMFVPCQQTCKACGPRHAHKPFDLRSSSTYEELPCDKCSCGASKKCTFNLHYSEGSSANGVYVQDMLSFGQNLTTKVRISFGCLERETKKIYGQDADGIVGLGTGSNSLFSQLQKKNFSPNFGLCFGSDNKGVLTFGKWHPEHSMYTPMKTRMHAKIIDILLGNESLSGGPNERVYGGSALLDTGSSDTALPHAVYAKLEQIFARTLKGKKANRGSTLCYDAEDPQAFRDSVPHMTIVFEGGAKVFTTFENMFYLPNAKKFCATVYRGGSVILGGNTLMNNFIYIDQEQNRVGLTAANCSEMGAALDRSVEERARAERPAAGAERPDPGLPGPLGKRAPPERPTLPARPSRKDAALSKYFVVGPLVFACLAILIFIAKVRRPNYVKLTREDSLDDLSDENLTSGDEISDEEGNL